MKPAIQNTNLYKKLATLLNEDIFGNELALEAIEPDKLLVQDVGLDDLDTVEFTMSVEDEFDVPIPDIDISRLTTLRDFYDFLIQMGFDPITCEKKGA